MLLLLSEGIAIYSSKGGFDNWARQCLAARQHGYHVIMLFFESALLGLALCGMMLCILGWGALAWRIVYPGRDFPFALPAIAPLGVAAIYICGVAVSLALPLYRLADWAFALAGFYGAFWGWKSRILPAPNWRLLALVVGFTFLAAAGVMLTPLNYDAGLYHMQVLRHLEYQPLELGLANIHDRFGFNSSLLVVSALMQGGPFGKDGGYAVTAALFLLFLYRCLQLFSRFWTENTPPVSSNLAALFALVWAANLNRLMFDWYSLGPNGDIPSALFCCWAFLEFFVWLETPGEADGPSIPALTVLATAAALGATMKLSHAPVAILVVAALMISLRHRSPESKFEWLRALALPLAAGASWIVFGVATSGCLAFPAGATCLSSLPWAISATDANAAGAAISAWARIPGVAPEQVPGGLAWLSGWESKMLPYRPIFYDLLASAFLGFFLAGAARIAQYSSRLSSPAPSHGIESSDAARMRRGSIWACTSCAAGVIFWFVQAPDPRFGLGFLITAVVLTTLFLLQGLAGIWEAPNTSRLLRWAFAALILLAGGVELRTLAVERADGAKFAWRNPPVSPTREVTTSSGLALRTPVNGNQCWDEAALCAPNERPALTRTRILGKTAYVSTGDGAVQPARHQPPAAGLEVAQTPSSVPAQPPAASTSPHWLPVFASDVWGAESAAENGKPVTVRWLQRDTGFTVFAPRSGKTRLRLRLASHDGDRTAELALNGNPAGPPAKVTGNFFHSPPQQIELTLELQAGENRINIHSQKECKEISPGRATCFLLVGEISVTPLP